jgi:hypothetical protein
LPTWPPTWPSHWPNIALPFGNYPVRAALQCLVIEFGTHRNDLEVALGDRSTGFSRPTLDALLGFGEQFLLLQAAPLESGPVTFVLDAPSATMSITWDGRRWAPGEGQGRRCAITGSDDAIGRLVLRRLDVTDPRLTVGACAELAHLFAAAIRPL